MDRQGHPLCGAEFLVYDSAHHQLEDPDEVACASGRDGKVSYLVPRSSAYYIQALADAYLPSEMKKVVPTANVVSIPFRLKPAPLPPYPITTIRATILDSHRHPVECAFLDVYSASGRGLGNVRGSSDLTADRQGHVEKTVRTGGVLTIRVQAYGYDPLKKTVRSRPGIIPLVFLLKRNGQPLSVLSH